MNEPLAKRFGKRIIVFSRLYSGVNSWYHFKSFTVVLINNFSQNLIHITWKKKWNLLLKSSSAKFYVFIFFSKQVAQVPSMFLFLNLWLTNDPKESVIWILSQCRSSRSSRPEVFCKNGVLRNLTKFIKKHLCQGLFFHKGLQLY